MLLVNYMELEVVWGILASYYTVNCLDEAGTEAGLRLYMFSLRLRLRIACVELVLVVKKPNSTTVLLPYLAGFPCIT